MSPYKLELEDDRCRSSAKVLSILVHYNGYHHYCCLIVSFLIPKFFFHLDENSCPYLVV